MGINRSKIFIEDIKNNLVNREIISYEFRKPVTKKLSNNYEFSYYNDIVYISQLLNENISLLSGLTSAYNEMHDIIEKNNENAKLNDKFVGSLNKSYNGYIMSGSVPNDKPVGMKDTYNNNGNNVNVNRRYGGYGKFSE